jgi:dCTP deaminase
MPLTKSKIKSRIRRGDIHVGPILSEEDQFETAKVDLRLDNLFYRMKAEKRPSHDSVDRFDDLFEEIHIAYEGHDAEFVLHPGEFALARTYETVKIPSDLVAELGGRSTLARQGIVVHATASVIDPGFVGYITLEMTNFGSVPVKVHPLQRVASLTFHSLDEDAERYHGRIPGAGEPVPTSADTRSVLDQTLSDKK